jgi:hypothetical protein
MSAYAMVMNALFSYWTCTYLLTGIPRRAGVDGRMSAYHEVQDHVHIVDIHRVALAVLQQGAEQGFFYA